MSAVDNGNKHAFPIGGSPGFSKREEFAKAAMQGMLANAKTTDVDLAAIGKLAVKAADYLLTALEAPRS